MSGKKRDNRTISIILMIGTALAALWYNEGRFNFYQASKNTIPLSSLSEATGDEIKGNSFSGNVKKLSSLKDIYVKDLGKFMFVHRYTEIYSWQRTKDSDGDVTWRKYWNGDVQDNHRNQGIQKTLAKDQKITHKNFKIEDLNIPPDVYFVDALESLDTGSLQLSEEGKNNLLVPIDRYFYKLSYGNSPNEIGNERVSYRGLPYFDTGTYFGKIKNNKAIMIKSKAVKNSVQKLINDHGNLHYFVKGERETALQTLKTYFSNIVWLVRGIATAVVILGIFDLFNRIISLFEIPFLSNMMRTGSFVISIILGTTVSAIVIFSSMIVHHPYLFILPVLLLFMAYAYMKKKEKTKSKVIKERLQHSTFHRSAETASAPATETENKPDIEKAFLNLARIALADDKLEKREKTFLVNWGKANGLQTETIKTLYRQAKEEQGKEIDSMTDQEFNFLIQMAYVDGHMSIQERHQINLAGRGMGKSKKEISQHIKDNLKPLEKVKKSDLMLKAG